MTVARETGLPSSAMFMALPSSAQGRPWKFYISRFDNTSCCSGTAGFCTVVCFDGSKERIPMDPRDRVFIAGLWFSRAHWTH